MDDGEIEEPVDWICFLDCTCDHEPGEHGWSECEVPGCNCEGHWEE